MISWGGVGGLLGCCCAVHLAWGMIKGIGFCLVLVE